MSRLPDSLPSPVWYAWSDVVYAWKSKCGCGAVCAGGSPAEDDAHESPDAVGAALAADYAPNGGEGQSEREQNAHQATHNMYRLLRGKGASGVSIASDETSAEQEHTGPPCAPRAGVYEGLVPTAACAKRVSILYAS